MLLNVIFTQAHHRILAMLILALAVSPQYLVAQYQSSESELLLLKVRLDRSVISDAIPAYEVGKHTFLPLGELARLLTIAVKTRPKQMTASGFILAKDRGFSLDLNKAQVTRTGVTEKFDLALVLMQPDDVYVAQSLLEQWLPVKLEINRSRMSLRVHALEALPLQARLKRERLGEHAGMHEAYKDPGYDLYKQPYQLLSMPYIDQTLTTELKKNDASTQTDARYTAFLTGDMLKMDSSLYFSSQKNDPTPDIRAILGRYDPNADLLGPLQARSIQLGSIAAPSVDNITRGSSGEGVTFSNQPLTQPSNFDQQTFEGDLALGWDVELYYNDALVGFQIADAESRYQFEGQPLNYGRNAFQLVFNGPLGQTRVQQYNFSLAQSMLRPGEFQYSFTEHRDHQGQQRSVAELGLGFSRYFSGSASFVKAPMGDTQEQYTNLGLRTFWKSTSISADLAQAEKGGLLAELGLKTRIGNVALNANHIQLSDFASDMFRPKNDPIRTRDELRLSGSIPLGEHSRLPVTIQARQDIWESGVTNTDISARVSAYIYRTALTNTLTWQASGDVEQTKGALLVSRRINGMSLRNQLNYTLGPESKIKSLDLTASMHLTEGYRMNLGVAHAFTSQQTSYTGGFTKSLGRYGLGVNASYVNTGKIALGVQLFVAMGQDPREAGWLFDARPMANNGAASAQMFLDDNENGVMDDDELPVSGVGFTVNGGRHEARTNATGVAHINHLPVKQDVNIGVDTSTLENPQWSPQLSGLKLVPRPGTVAKLDFPVMLTTEIDGTIYLQENNTKRGVSDVNIELLDAQREVVATATSSWDGFYIVPHVVAGDYWLRVSPRQLQRLGLAETSLRKLNVSGDGSFISGVDFIIVPSGK
jgi:hypothetical protein